VVLLEQPFIKDPKKTVQQVLTERGVAVRAFARFQIGQAG
jgi:elongation factor Ts